METKNNSLYLESVRGRWFRGYNATYVDPRGLSGGLAVWWDTSINFTVLSESQNVIHACIKGGEFDIPVFASFVYGPTDDNERWRVWDCIRKLAPDEGCAWVSIGDFNDIASRGEKWGGNPKSLYKIWKFQSLLFDCGFFDMGFQGQEFTWTNNQIGPHYIKERLDRVVCNQAFSDHFLKAQVFHLDPVGLDHCPVFLQLNYCDKRTSRVFKFEQGWIDHPDFFSKVADSWMDDVNPSVSSLDAFCEKLSRCRRMLSLWSKEAFPNSKKQIDSLTAELQVCMNGDFTEEKNAEVAAILSKIELAWDREEKYWEHRARVNWLRAGDQNTKFFHSTTVHRRKRNKILKLLDEDGLWHDKEDDIAGIFLNFYKHLFSSSSPGENEDILEFARSVITEDDNVLLSKPVNDSEVKEAAFQLGGMKAPGPDGFSGIFYHSSWDVIGKEVTAMVKDFFDLGTDLAAINGTNIVLVPKVEAASVNHFRPISLCNFSYKVISKIIVNRMKPLLPKCISPNQRTFVPGRLIQDNLMVAHEAFHHLKTKKSGRRYEMAIKVDMNKAYDRVEWSFVRKVLLKMGFCLKWVDNIMRCVSSVHYSLLLSGKKVGSFQPERGLRQGDPLSPYLFIIVADVLSNMVTSFAEVGEFEGIKLALTCPVLTHCFFADDALFFMKADLTNSINFKNMLDWYCAASGQAINLDKSCIFFSNNVPKELKDEICDCLGIVGSENLGKYLGLPVLWGRSKCEALNFVKERMVKKLQGWKQNVLSQASREILIKAVASAIPVYPMSCFKFPKKICNVFNSYLAKFWWGQQKDEGKIHWKSWESLIKSKQEGGMGFREFEAFNLALLAKQCWRIITNPDDFWVKMLKGLYFPNSVFLSAKKGSKASWGWSSLLEGRYLLKKGLAWKVGDGSSINIWMIVGCLICQILDWGVDLLLMIVLV